MCGIIARVGIGLSPKRSLDGLKFLEYRGYDSYGVLFSKIGGDTLVSKDINELPLDEFENLMGVESNIEIGHTRWATHGGVSKVNAHPHFDSKNEFFVVMNGIIENYLDIKSELINLGYEFVSETDTEVLVHLFSRSYKDAKDSKDTKDSKGVKDAKVDGSVLLGLAKNVFSQLKGEFSCVVKFKDSILAYKNINPIVVGLSDGEVILCSDSGFIQNNSDKFYVMNDCEIMISSISDLGVSWSFYDENFAEFEPKFMKSVSVVSDDSNEFSTYMEKEILEQKFLRNLIDSENLSSIRYLRNVLKSKKLVLTAAGTSYHAAYFMHYKLLELGIMSDVIVASELSNYVNVISNSVIVVFSQSGETADLVYPLKKLRDSNEVFTITNTANSTLARFANRVVHLNCGREVSVASTKAFSFQLFFIEILYSRVNEVDFNSHLLEFEEVFDDFIVNSEKSINEICETFKNSSDIFLIGRDSLGPFSLEGALKLKECTYIHAEGFFGGELKHGTLALITKRTPVIVLGDSDEIISNAIEIKTRGGVLIGISSDVSEVFDYCVRVPKVFKEVFTTIVIQRLSLKISLALGLNPDKPRNLAKSVTVK